MKNILLLSFATLAMVSCSKSDNKPAASTVSSSATVSHISLDNPSFADGSTCMYSNATGAATYLWDFGDGQTSTMAAPCHTYSLDGTFTVTLTVDGDPTKRTSAAALVYPTPGFSSEIGGMHTWRHMLMVTGDTTYYYPDTAFPVTYVSPTTVSVLGGQIPCTYAGPDHVYFKTDGKPRYESLSFTRRAGVDSLFLSRYRRWDASKATLEYFYAP